jgi:hypothetical protein
VSQVLDRELDQNDHPEVAASIPIACTADQHLQMTPFGHAQNAVMGRPIDPITFVWSTVGFSYFTFRLLERLTDVLVLVPWVVAE